MTKGHIVKIDTWQENVCKGLICVKRLSHGNRVSHGERVIHGRSVMIHGKRVMNVCKVMNGNTEMEYSWKN